MTTRLATRRCPRTVQVIAPVLFGTALTTTEAMGAEISAAGLARVTTNYVYRGYSKSDDHAAVQGNFDLRHASGMFLGGWVSSVDFGGAEVEVNPYVGWNTSLSADWWGSITVSGYWYDDRVLGRRADYAELSGLIGYRDLGSLRMAVAPDYLGSGDTVSDYAAELHYPLTDTWEVSGGLGYQSSRSAIGYDMVYGNIGFTWFAQRHLTLDLRYHDAQDTNERSHGGRYSGADNYSSIHLDRPLVLSLSVGF